MCRRTSWTVGWRKKTKFLTLPTLSDRLLLIFFLLILIGQNKKQQLSIPLLLAQTSKGLFQVDEWTLVTVACL